jgi:hypothetical protein
MDFYEEARLKFCILFCTLFTLFLDSISQYASVIWCVPVPSGPVKLAYWEPPNFDHTFLCMRDSNSIVAKNLAKVNWQYSETNFFGP